MQLDQCTVQAVDDELSGGIEREGALLIDSIDRNRNYLS